MDEAILLASSWRSALGFGAALARAAVYSTDREGKRHRRKHAKGDPGCATCGVGQWRCSKLGKCCPECWHPNEVEARETRSYYTGGERVEHAEGLAVAIRALPLEVRRAWALRYSDRWEWRTQEVASKSELNEKLEGDWYRVADNVVQSQFRVYATFDEIAAELGVSASTARAWVKKADEAIARAWL